MRFLSLFTYWLFLFVIIVSSPRVHAFQEDETKQTNTAAKKETSEENKENATSEGNQAASKLPAFPPRSEIEIAAPVNAAAQQENDIKHYLPEQDIQPVLSGPEDHLTLVETNTRQYHKGVIILLSDWQQNATNPTAINHLRTTLPQQGWTTISIQPPSKPEGYPSILSDKAAQERTNTETLAQYKKSLAELMTTVFVQAKTYPGIIVLISEGHHASLMYSLFYENQIEQPMAFVSLSGFLPDQQSMNQSAQHLSMIDLPVLDLFLKTDNRLIRQNAQMRKKLVNQELKSNYRQKQLFNIQTSYYPKAVLVKEISGWLKTIGW